MISVGSVSEGFAASSHLTPDASAVEIRIAPRSTAGEAFGKAVVRLAAGGGRVLSVSLYARVFPTATGSRGRAPLWIEARPVVDEEGPRFADALPLSEDEWDSQIEPILARWTPETRIVILGQPAVGAVRIAARLKDYGLQAVYGLVPLQ